MLSHDLYWLFRLVQFDEIFSSKTTWAYRLSMCRLYKHRIYTKSVCFDGLY